jgi:positive regulator of sigma E activity
MLAFLVPLLILLAILIVSIHFFSLSQISAAMISLIGVAVYYIVLYLFRNRLERSFAFHLKQS